MGYAHFGFNPVSACKFHPSNCSWKVWAKIHPAIVPEIQTQSSSLSHAYFPNPSTGLTSSVNPLLANAISSELSLV